MKTILIATDFSSASRNAFIYGVLLAEQLQANVKLVHAYQLVLTTPDILPVVTANELLQESKQRLDAELAALPFKTVINITTESLEGSATDCILKAAKEIRAEYIIAGMKGEAKTFRKIFGSTALSLSRHTKVPLIVVPENAAFVEPSTIALATDIDNETNMHILDPLCDLGNQFQSTVYIVRVIKRKEDELVDLLLRPSRLKWHLKQLHPSFEFMNDNDVAHALTEFIREHNVNMVAMIAQEHNFIERLLVKSNIKAMLFESTVPLLILPGNLQNNISEMTIKYSKDEVG